MHVNAFKRRRPTGGVALLFLAGLIVGLLAGCGPLLPSPTSTPKASSAAVPTQAQPSFSGTPTERLTRALTAFQGGYTFETTVQVAGVEAAHVTGRWFGSASELSITSGGATVTYRIIPPKAYVQDAAGIWAEADAPATSGDPLSGLLAPSSITAGTGASGTDQVIATYPAAALGLTGADPVSVTISIAADGSITAHYQTPVPAGMATSETVIKAGATQAPILAPSPLPSPSA